MKFVCLKCEAYMAFENVEVADQGRLGITFGCPSCAAQFSMVTNPGETQLVSSLGVTLGGRTAPYAPLEMTRQTLKEDTGALSGSMAAYLDARAGRAAKPEAADGSGAADPMAGCPFSALVRDMGLGANPDAAPPSQAGAGDSGMSWAAEAAERLNNIPDFIRPMARKEIERLARARGAATVTDEIMDLAKVAFGNLAGPSPSQRTHDPKAHVVETGVGGVRAAHVAADVGEGGQKRTSS